MGRHLLLAHSLQVYSYKGQYYPVYEGGFHTTQSLQQFDGYIDHVAILCQFLIPQSADDIVGRVPLEFRQITFLDVGSRHLPRLSVIKQAVRQCDVVIARLPSTIGLLVAREAKKQGKKILIEVVGNEFEALWYHSLKGKLIAYPLHWLCKSAILHADYVTYITHYYLQSVYPSNGISCDFLPNVTIDFSSLTLEDRLQRRMERHRALRGSQQMIVIGMIASYSVRYKGHATLFKAISRLLNKHPEIRRRMAIELVGASSSKRLEKLAKNLGIRDLVKFKGVMPNSSVLEWLDNVDVYVQPSQTEAAGRSIVEALSRGCLVITSDVGGMREVIDSEWRFPKDDSENFSKLIFKALNLTQSDRDSLARIGIEKSKDYDKDRIQDKRLAFTLKALG